jgi:hypothetical protein
MLLCLSSELKICKMKKQKQKQNIIRNELNPKWETCCPTLFWRAKKSENIFELETFFELADYDWRQAED